MSIVSAETYSAERRLQPLITKYIKKDKNFNKNVLDVGCGDGRYRFFFEGLAYTGADIYNPFVINQREQFNFVKLNGLVLPFNDSEFDVVFCKDVLEHVEKDADFIGEIYRVLKKNGVLIVTVPSNYAKLFNVFPKYFFKNIKFVEHGYRNYSKKDITSLHLDNGFEINYFGLSAGFAATCIKTIYEYKKYLRMNIRKEMHKHNKESTPQDLFTDNIIEDQEINKQSLPSKVNIIRKCYRLFMK